MLELVDRRPEERHPIHDDLELRRLVDDDRISAVLDWGSSTLWKLPYDIAKLDRYRPWYAAWRDIDFRAEARAHCHAVGLTGPDIDARLTCCALRIGLSDMAASASADGETRWRGRRRRTLELARLDPSDRPGR